jgi:hypothetical protein
VHLRQSNDKSISKKPPALQRLGIGAPNGSSAATKEGREDRVAEVIEEYEHCLEIWRAARTDDVLLPPMPRTDALSFRRRLYRIRAAMGRQQHPYYERWHAPEYL